jgi:uncharacterized protein YyaL (SSP411 family)
VTEAIGRAAGGIAIEAVDAARIPPITVKALATVRRSFDERWGGFGGAPKFPQASLLRWLLDRGTHDAYARTMVCQTLDGMADGGIHDHVGGGFARYSTDAMWHVPHFEKMLYDNAQLLALYAHAAVLTRRERYRKIASHIASWMLSEMQQPDGGFSSSQDADSDGVEGAFFVWSWGELTSIVGETVAAALGATPEGNWEGTNVLWRPRSGAEHGIDEAASSLQIEHGLRALAEQRSTRTRPATDDKIVTAWNGIAIGALAIAGSSLGDPSLLEAAQRCASFLWEHLRDRDGRLLRSWRGGAARVPGFADDHALVGLGFCALYERTGRTEWLLRARELGERLLALFAAGDGGFYQVGSDAEALVVRKLDLHDDPVPSGSSAAAELLLRLGRYFGDRRYEDHAAAALGRVLDICERAPAAAGGALRSLELYGGPTVEVAIVGEPSSPSTRELVDAVVGRERYLPNAIVGVADPADAQVSKVRLFDDRLQVTEATAYVCERFVCQAPVTTAEDLVRELSPIAGSPRR